MENKGGRIMHNKNTNTMKTEITTKTLLDNISNNLSALLKKNKITQKKLHQITGVSESTVSEYVNGRKVPSVEFLVSLKREYGISIDDFVMTESNVYEIPDSSNKVNLEINNGDIEKIAGTYLVYYFKTSSFKGRDETPVPEAITHGVLKIVDNATSGNSSSCLAVMGIDNINEACQVKDTLDNLPNDVNVFEFAKKNFNDYYNGTFEILEKNVCISLFDNYKDKVSIILHKVISNKPKYIGGIGTMNSVSKGRGKSPVIQYIGLSRERIEFSEEEISNSLLLDLPKFSANYETSELIKLFSSLYLDVNRTNSLTETQKNITMKANIERHIQKILIRNIFRYSKISDRDDDDWYHMLKDSIERKRNSEK